MSAAIALKAARDAGISLRVDGADLVLEAPAPPSATVINLLTRHKAELIVLLRFGGDEWSIEDWHAHFDERAGIAEFDGGLPRPEAETLAFECCVTEWLNRNLEHSPPEVCVACGGADTAHDALSPFGIEPISHAWLHSRCWPSWYAGRRADAIIALRAIGIFERSNET